jgi:hypothetical protein
MHNEATVEPELVLMEVQPACATPHGVHTGCWYPRKNPDELKDLDR